jgi:hypothetical protein
MQITYKMTILYLQIVFAESKNANVSVRICLANNLFAHADAKIDAEISPLFANYSTCGASLPVKVTSMVPLIPQDDFGPFDFSSEILCEFDFGAEFDFGRDFSSVGDGVSTSSWSFGSFKYDGVSIHYSSDETN